MFRHSSSDFPPYRPFPCKKSAPAPGRTVKLQKRHAPSCIGSSPCSVFASWYHIWIAPLGLACPVAIHHILWSVLSSVKTAYGWLAVIDSGVVGTCPTRLQIVGFPDRLWFSCLESEHSKCHHGEPVGVSVQPSYFVFAIASPYPSSPSVPAIVRA